MGSELFSLEWDKFQINAGNTLKMLLADTNYTDVTLACDDDKQIKAHKVILSSCSSFFQNLLLKNPHPNPLIYMKGITYAEMDSIVKFMYLGQTEVKQEDLKHFMEIAQELKIKGLLGESGKAMAEVSSSQDDPEVKEGNVEDAVNVKHEYESSDQNNTLPENNYNDETPDNGVECIQSFESNTESFNCEQCDFETKSSSSLHRHQKFFCKQKYPCNQCEKVFSLPHGLVQHKKKVHADTIILQH